MGIISIRLNKNDEKILDFLKQYYEQDKSSLIKNIMKEKFEDLQDLSLIDSFESKLSDDNVSFESFDEIIKEL